ncbi:tyrosine-type recombinase/integrase [Pelagicoccus mobilis]|uniref:Site-specific integrase n=1 Tax=Pelagicoccus mobilis TaxID=415221 RepID=A0A934VUJ3_9BACT|nr:site-specific integrase [Pelagicoccus mobilis]MBK1880594.1 site-specific integrase [Pelagicoccus mobilis]
MKYLHTPFYRKDKRLWVIGYRNRFGDLMPPVYAKTQAEARETYKQLQDKISKYGAPKEKIDPDRANILTALDIAALEHGIDIKTLVEKEIERRSGANGAITIGEAATKFLKGDFKKRYEPSTQSTNKSTIEKFVANYGDTPLFEFSEDHVFDYQDKLLTEISVDSTKREIYTLSAFFHWSTLRKQKFITKNPFAYWDPEEIEEYQEEKSAPKIFNTTEWQKILDTALKYDPYLIPALTLSKDAGMRTCEILRIDPSDIDIKNETIVIRKTVTKKASKGVTQGRTIENLPSKGLWLYLKPHANTEGKLAKLDRNDYHRRKKRIISKALNIPENELTLENEGRHSFASHSYALTKDAGRVRHWLGQRRDSVTWNHYINMELSEAEAEAYHAIKPPADYIKRLAAWTKTKVEKTVDWPDNETLKTLIWSQPVTHVAQKIGTSDNAVRKRCKKYGIKLPPRGHWQKRRALENRSS